MCKRVLSFFVSLVIVFSLVSCSGSEGEQPVDTTTTTTTTTTTKAITTTKTAEQTTTAGVTTTGPTDNPFAEPLELSYLVLRTANYIEGRWDELELEEMFNIDLKVWNIDAASAEQCIMMAAAGDWPDTGFLNGYDPVMAYEEGLTRDISLQQIKTMLPEYYTILEDNPVGLLYNKIPTEKDKFYGLSFCQAANNYWYHVNCFRLDWLSHIGFDIDDLTEVKITNEKLSKAAEGVIYLSNRAIKYDEYLEILRAFTEDDPDNDGVDDTYGAMFPQFAPNFGGAWSNNLTCMFGIPGHTNNNTWLYKSEDTGDYVPMFAVPGWRDFLIFINNMLTKGYMTYMGRTAGNSNYYANFYGNISNETYGHFPVDSRCNMNPNYPDYLENWFPNCILDRNPDATFVIVPAILGPTGIGGDRRYVDLPFREGAFGTWTFGIGCTDEKLQRALAMMQYTHFTTEGFFRYYYGIEDVHYTWSGEPFKSAVLLTDPAKIPKKYSGGLDHQSVFASDNFLMDWNLWSLESEWFAQLCKYQVEHDWYLNYTLEPHKLCNRACMGNELFEEYTELKNSIHNDILAVANDFRDKAFNGELANIYDEWSSYITALYSAGLDKYVEIFNRKDFALFETDKSKLYKYDY